MPSLVSCCCCGAFTDCSHSVTCSGLSIVADNAKNGHLHRAWPHLAISDGKHCYAVLCCAVLCCAVLCCAVLCCDVLCCHTLTSLISAGSLFYKVISISKQSIKASRQSRRQLMMVMHHEAIQRHYLECITHAATSGKNTHHQPGASITYIFSYYILLPC